MSLVHDIARVCGEKKGGEGRAYAYCGRTELDGFEGVFDLEEAAFGRESAVGEASVSMDDVEGYGGGVIAYLIPRSGKSLSISNSNSNGLCRGDCRRSVYHIPTAL